MLCAFSSMSFSGCKCVMSLDSVSKNPIGDDGLAAIMEALIEKPDALKKLG